jgi:hypothetical protein
MNLKLVEQSVCAHGTEELRTDSSTAHNSTYKKLAGFRLRLTV